jgi:flagellar protein FlaJ
MTINEEAKKVNQTILEEKRIIKEMNSLLNSFKFTESQQEKNMFETQIQKLKTSLRNTNETLLKNIETINIKNPLVKPTVKSMIEPAKIEKRNATQKDIKFIERKEKITLIEKEIIERIKKKEEKFEKKKGKPSEDYKKLAEKTFSNFAKSLIKQKTFQTLGADLVKSNLNHTLISYVSLLIFNSVIAFGIAFVLFIFLLFFNISPIFPIITQVTENLGIRFLETFWLLLVIPGATFLFMYTYPSLEKKSLSSKIEYELPFAAIHMAAISGSMINPVKVFSIIASTKEYPNLEKEFNKLLNEINIYGYDLVSALKDIAANSPSQKLAELFNGLATTITSGGSMYDFFEKRSQTLLFDYKLEKEKATKSAETFMDIYISIVIAAPMILMLLLMMMKISGLGISLSTSMITGLVVGGVSLINIFFIAFLQIKQQSTG